MTAVSSRVTCSTVFALFVPLVLCGWGPGEVQAALGPTLSNDTVAYHWAPAEQGGGLIGIEDGTGQAGLLDPTSPAAPWWQVKLKDGRTIANTDLPCSTRSTPNTLTVTWTGDIRVVVTSHLGADDNLLRSRIHVDAAAEGVGLRDVVFPVLDGIRPLAKDAADDRLLHAYRTGYTEPTPLTTGKPVNSRYCISYYMQFTALLGGGRGLYIGDHDPTAAWKDMSWTPNRRFTDVAVCHIAPGAQLGRGRTRQAVQIARRLRNRAVRWRLVRRRPPLSSMGPHRALVRQGPHGSASGLSEVVPEHQLLGYRPPR